MDKLEIAVALIRRIGEQIHWLGKLNHADNTVDFVIAGRLEKESWRESVTREVAWELGIDRKRDFIVSNMAQLNIEMEMVLPGSTSPTEVACAFYNVELYRKATIAQFQEHEDFVWLTSNEICDGVTKSGAKLNPMILSLNSAANVIQHWESDLTGE